MSQDSFPIFTPVQLLGAFGEDSKTEKFWKSMCFSSAPIFSDDRSIEFTKYNTLRRVAPFVRPQSDGLPIYSNRETVERVRTAYIKMEDTVRANDFTGRREIGAGELGGRGQRMPLTPRQRWNFRISEITKQHEEAKENRLELMCFQAIANAVVEVRYADTNTVDNVVFERDPAHTIQNVPGTFWNEPGVNPLLQISEWRRIMHRPTGPQARNRFKAKPTMFVMGRLAGEAFRTSEEVRRELDVDIKNMGGKTEVNRQVLEGMDIELIGRLNDGSPVYIYNEYFEDENGQIVEIMDPRDVIALNPAMVNGQVAYGTIENFKADLASLEIFPSMYPSQNGSAIFLCHESAPMVFPVNPNATLRARVIA